MFDLPPRVLAVQRANELGYSRTHVATEVRHGRWQRLATGVLFTRPDAPTRSDWAHAGVLLGGPDAVVTGWDVVRLQKLGTDRPPRQTVLVLTQRGKNREVGGVRLRPSHRIVTARRTNQLDRTLPGVAVASIARAIADTALDYRRLEPVRAMVLQAVQRGLCTVDQLLAELDAAPRNGTGHLRLALRDAAGGARSIAEAEAFELLRREDIPPFEPNAPVLGRAGRVVAVADALWPHLRAILEVDSREHHFSERDWKRTMIRHNELTALGYAVAHYPPSAIRSGGPIWADGVAGWLTARAAELDVELFP